MKKSLATLTINEVTLDWTDSDKRTAKPCRKCGKPTQGRGVIGGETFPACVGCAIAIAMEAGAAMSRHVGGLAKEVVEGRR